MNPYLSHFIAFYAGVIIGIAIVAIFYVGAGNHLIKENDHDSETHLGI